MKRIRTMPLICCASAACLTLLGVILRTVAMFTRFNDHIGYFDPGAVPTISNILYGISVVLSLIGACAIPKESLPQNLRTPGRIFPSLLLGSALALSSVLLILLPASTFPVGNALMRGMLIIFGLFGSLYFFLSCRVDGCYSDGLAALGYIPILWCLVGVAETYMDLFIPMNSPVKLAMQMGFVGFMFILISELRFRFGKSLPRVAVALMSIGIFLTMNASIPTLAMFKTWDNQLYLLYALVLGIAGLYGLYVLFCLTCLPPASHEANDPEPLSEPSEAAPS